MWVNCKHSEKRSPNSYSFSRQNPKLPAWRLSVYLKLRPLRWSGEVGGSYFGNGSIRCPPMLYPPTTSSEDRKCQNAFTKVNLVRGGYWEEHCTGLEPNPTYIDHQLTVWSCVCPFLCSKGWPAVTTTIFIHWIWVEFKVEHNLPRTVKNTRASSRPF